MTEITKLDLFLSNTNLDGRQRAMLFELLTENNFPKIKPFEKKLVINCAYQEENLIINYNEWNKIFYLYMSIVNVAKPSILSRLRLCWSLLRNKIKTDLILSQEEGILIKEFLEFHLG